MTAIERPPEPWERHLEEQARSWLRLTYEQRLAWLEGAKEFTREALGAAHRRPASKTGSGEKDTR